MTCTHTTSHLTVQSCFAWLAVRAGSCFHMLQKLDALRAVYLGTCVPLRTLRAALQEQLYLLCANKQHHSTLSSFMAQHPEPVMQILTAVVWHKCFFHQAISSKGYLFDTSHHLGPQHCTSCLRGCYHSCVHLPVSNLTVSTSLHGSESCCKAG